MKADYAVEYFLGANSPQGFYSLYDQLIDLELARRVYIIKGGPGSGKSTLMGRVAGALEEAGHGVERILCSGDPDSLDGVVCGALGVALADGTAPHVLEPKYPGAVEEYVNLGRFCTGEELREKRADIKGLMAGYKDCYRRAYRCLAAAAQVEEDVHATLMTEELAQQLARRAQGIVSRELKGKKGAAPGAVKQRFLDGITCKGRLTLFGTVMAQCGRVYELTDRYGLGHELLTHLLAGAVNNGHDVVACPDPMRPTRLNHLLVPGCSLAFVTTRPGQSFPGEVYRTVHLEGMVDEELLRRSRPRLRFVQKVANALTEEAVGLLGQAKALHDELEGVYHPFVDFAGVAREGERILEEILEAQAH